MDGTNTDSEKVEQLTDIFHEITGESSTTERQHEDRWASVSADNSDGNDAIRSIVREMTDEYGIQTSLDEDELVMVVRNYHAGGGDREIARTLGTPNRDKTIARARISLHLFETLISTRRSSCRNCANSSIKMHRTKRSPTPSRRVRAPFAPTPAYSPLKPKPNEPATSINLGSNRHSPILRWIATTLTSSAKRCLQPRMQAVSKMPLEVVN